MRRSFEIRWFVFFAILGFVFFTGITLGKMGNNADAAYYLKQNLGHDVYFNGLSCNCKQLRPAMNSTVNP